MHFLKSLLLSQMVFGGKQGSIPPEMTPLASFFSCGGLAPPLQKCAVACFFFACHWRGHFNCVLEIAALKLKCVFELVLAVKHKWAFSGRKSPIRSASYRVKFDNFSQVSTHENKMHFAASQCAFLIFDSLPWRWLGFLILHRFLNLVSIFVS